RADAEALTEAYEGASLSLSILGTEWTAYADAFLYWQSQQAEAAENPAETCTLIVLNAAEMLGIVLQQGQIAYTQALPLSATAPNAAAYPLQINNTFSTQTAQEICRFLQFYRTSAAFPAQDSSAEPARIFLMGRAAQQADLPQAVEQECNIAAEYICPPLLLRPSENAASAGFPEYSDQPNKEWTERAADFNLAFGLALQQLYPTAHRVNLLPDSTKNTVSPVRKQMAAAVLFGSLTAAIAAFALDYAASQQAQRNALLQNALAELDTQYQQSAALRAEKAALLQQQKLLSGVAEQRIQTALFWQTLNTAMPSETVLTELAPDNGGYRLLGAAADEETAAQTLRALNAADWAFTAELLLQKRNAENGAQHFTILLRPNAAEAGQQNKTEAEQ
ncbi:MAG: hypothetical protein Q4D82_03245, partial [Neisseria sp.]|nr:hypothetical protein [Neisseria sp.]